jgi:predicted peptidase
MTRLLALAVAAALTQMPVREGTHDLAFVIPGFGQMRYAVSLPDAYDPDEPRPLVLALHAGGQRFPGYGRVFMQQIVQPAAAGLEAVIVAPDCPTNAWSDPLAEQAVVQLLDHLAATYAIDRRRVLVTGFSLGGRGTWFMASRHGDLFTAAIPIAASTRDLPADTLGLVPTYVIHSRADEVVPFAPAEQVARELERLGRPVRFEAFDDFPHYEMFRYVDALRRGVEWVEDQWEGNLPH